MPEAHVNDVERDLAALVALEPSAEFTGSVRERIGAAPDARWLSPRAWAAAAALVTFALALGATAMRGRSVPRTGVSATAPPSIALPAGERPTRASVPRPSPLVHRPAGLTTPTPPVKEPALIVDPELAVAMRRLFTMAQSRTADEALATAATRSIAEAPQDLAVAPMVIGDLAVTSIQRVERR